MSLQENPFYILELSCSAGRSQVIAAYDEKSFMLDSDVCDFAKDTLINTNKRLSAELDWFPEATDSDLKYMRSCIANNQKIEETNLSFSGTHSLSALNVALYNFPLRGIRNAASKLLCSAICDIDKQYCILDSDEIAYEINACRNIARLVSVQVGGVEAELSKKRESVCKIINGKLELLEANGYVEIMTMLAGEYANKLADDEGAVISDLLDVYELKKEKEINDCSVSIKNYIEQVIQTADNNLHARLETLITLVKEWDKLAQPLQLRAQASGVEHTASINMGREIRNLSIFLHNEKGLTSESLYLTTAMKPIFAELEEFSDLLGEDSNTLVGLMERSKTAAVEKELIADFENLKKLGEDLVSDPSPFPYDFIDSLERLCRKAKNAPVDDDFKRKLLENVCITSRSVAIDLHNKLHFSNYALEIIEALLEIYGNESDLAARLTNDKTTLISIIRLKNPVSPTVVNPGGATSGNASATGRKKDKSLFQLLLVLAVIFVFFIIWLNSSTSTSTTSSSSYSNNNSSNYSSGSSSTNYKQYTNPRFEQTGTKVYDYIKDIRRVWYITNSANEIIGAVYKCRTTASNDTICIYMTVDQYKNNFDSSITLSDYKKWKKKRIRFDKPQKIYGVVVDSNTVAKNLARDVGNVMISFTGVNRVGKSWYSQ